MRQVTPQQARDRAAAHVASRLDFAKASFWDASERPWRTTMVRWAAGSSFDRPNGSDRLDSCLQGQHRVGVLGPNPEAP